VNGTMLGAKGKIVVAVAVAAAVGTIVDGTMLLIADGDAVDTALTTTVGTSLCSVCGVNDGEAVVLLGIEDVMVTDGASEGIALVVKDAVVTYVGLALNDAV